jgi:hypothetical protein
MSSMSNWLESELLNHVLRNSATASPVTVYAALFTSDPTDADVGTEVSGGSYARQSVTFGVVVSGATDNTGLITYPVATADWGVVSHVGIYDAVGGGNLLFHAPMTSVEQVLNGQTFTFPIGQLRVTLD